jgi:Ca-activated chloride channel family protein
MAAGDYELRYVDGETGAVLASAAIHVNAVTAGLEVPKHAVVGRRFEVVWQGPAADGDFIAVCKPGMPAHRYLDWAATTVGSPVSLAAPDKPGRYEVRYVAERGREVLAVTSIEIRP